MDKIYEDCPFCMREILQEPILEKHQGRYSLICPHCLSHRSEWVESIEKAVVSWNTYIREEITKGFLE
jgi:transcription elongation factor Elf1